MPNHCTNQVRIYGPVESAKALFELMTVEEDGKLHVTFDKLIPKPKVFDGLHTGGATLPDGSYVTRWYEVEINGQRHIEAVPESTLAKWEAEYGARDWYDWGVKHWGTKWDAYSSETVEYHEYDDCAEIELEFDTAWGPPEPVFKEMRRRFPDLTYAALYLIEGGWEGCGQCSFE